MLPHAIVAFIDFLGFRAMVDHDSAQSQPRYLPAILSVLDRMEERARNAKLSVTQFSDSVVVASEFSPTDAAALIDAVRDIQRLLIERGILVRGGIAFGRHYADGGRLFSKALVNAYELESRRAKFPRVLLDHNLLDWVLNHRDADGPVKQKVKQSLVRDRDGETFVGYLDDSLLDAHRDLVRETLATGATEGASVLAKAHWMVDYHQHVSEAAGRCALSPQDAARFRGV